MRRHRARALITTAAALAFMLAGSADALADDTGTTNDQANKDQATDRPVRSDHVKDRRPDRVGDHPTDRPKDRPKDRPTDHPTDRPTDRPHLCDRDPAADRPERCRDHDLRTIWERCKQAAQSDDTIDNGELREICHRLLWKHNQWRRCLHWAAGQSDLRPTDDRRELWKLCHRALWNHKHPV